MSKLGAARKNDGHKRAGLDVGLERKQAPRHSLGHLKGLIEMQNLPEELRAGPTRNEVFQLVRFEGFDERNRLRDAKVFGAVRHEN